MWQSAFSPLDGVHEELNFTTNFSFREQSNKILYFYFKSSSGEVISISSLLVRHELVGNLCPFGIASKSNEQIGVAIGAYVRKNVLSIFMKIPGTINYRRK